MTPPFAQVQVSVNGGGNVSGGVAVPSAATVQLSPVSTVGWGTPTWQIYSYPPGYTAPAGWSTDAAGNIYSTAVTPPSITLPANSSMWGKWAIRLSVAIQGSVTLVDEATIVRMLSPSGQYDTCFNETNQFDTRELWIADYRHNLRVIESALGGGGASLALSSFISVGTTPAGVGFVRLGQASQVPSLVRWRNNANSADLSALATDTGDTLYLGCESTFSGSLMASILRIYALSGGIIGFGNGGSTSLSWDSSGVHFPAQILNGANPIIGDTGQSSPYGVHGSVSIALAGSTHTCTAAEYANGEIHVTGTGTNVIKLPAVTSDANTYVKYIFNSGSGTLAVQDTSSHAAAATLPAGAGAWFRFGNATVKQMTAAFTVA